MSFETKPTKMQSKGIAHSCLKAALWTWFHVLMSNDKSQMTLCQNGITPASSNTVIELSTFEPKIEWLNPADTRHWEKMTGKNYIAASDASNDF